MRGSGRGVASERALLRAGVAVSALAPLVGASVAFGGEAPRGLVEALAEILRAPELERAEVGVHVRDLETGEALFEQNGARLFNPASNVKLVTSAAALHYLSPTYRFRTTIERDPELASGVLAGNLYVRGFGDPTLTTEELFGLVNDVALLGVREIRGDLVVDDTFFDRTFEGPGWDQELSDRSYAPPIGALSVNFGTFSVVVAPGSTPGSAASVSLWPDVPSLVLEPMVLTSARRTRPRFWIGTTKEPDGSIRVSVRGSIAVDESYGATFYKRVHDPTRFAGETIARMLALRGVTLKGKVRAGATPPGRVPVATKSSRPLAEIVSTLNKYSNNFIAEMILKTLAAERYGAPGTWEKGSLALGDFLKDVGVAPSTFVVGNGSGLNDVNRLTPEQLTLVLAEMYRRPELRPEFVASLAVAGHSGTITSRFQNTAADNRLRAKTGSLTGVSALSGYVVTRDGRTLAFSVMMNGYDGRARQMWKIQDRIGATLADFDTRPAIARP